VTDVGCCWHHHHGPWCWGDPREIDDELWRRRGARPDREPDALRDLQERQSELEHELTELRERIRAKTS
jgi:hypothetical protein